MIGAIVGDIIGSSYEFYPTKDYNFQLFNQYSNFTDDSLMTVAVADWLLKDPSHSHKILEERMVEWGSKFPLVKGGYGGMFNNWLFYPGGERKPYNSWGNGSAMRVSAVGWAFDTLEETLRVAELSASITHSHPEGIKGAQATAAAIFLARTGSSKEQIKDYIQTKFGYDLQRHCDDIRPLYHFESSCQKTVPESIIAFLDSADFESSIRLAVSLGGDADTMGAITGAIAEAYYKEIPQWIVDKAEKYLKPDMLAVLRKFGGAGSSAALPEGQG